MKIALIRHGKTLGNKRGVYLGLTDEELSEEGKKEIIYFKSKNIYPKYTEIYTSPLKRCIQTKDIIYNSNSEIIEDFREMDFGVFEYKTYKQIISNPVYSDFGSSEEKMYFPKGEKIEDFKKRCQNAFENIVKKGKDSVIICHGGTIMAILDKYGIPQNVFFQWQCENGTGFIIEIKNNNTINIERISI